MILQLVAVSLRPCPLSGETMYHRLAACLLLVQSFIVAPVLAENDVSVLESGNKTAGQFANLLFTPSSAPKLASAIALIYDEQSGSTLYAKNATSVVPIASITKLMTAMVVLDAGLPLDEKITITRDDADFQKGTRSRIREGASLTRGELLKLALMASENRAAAALARTYPGGTRQALAAMNAKARRLGMDHTRFFDATGLNSGNVSTAQDLVKMVLAAQNYELIREFSTSPSHQVMLDGQRRPLHYSNTNPLVRSSAWDIALSKTGYISEAGRCLVMQARILNRPMVIVLLDSWGKRTRIGDANRIKQWIERTAMRGERNGRVQRS